MKGRNSAMSAENVLNGKVGEVGMKEFIIDEDFHPDVSGYPELVRCKDCRHCTFYDGEQLADCMIKQGWFPVKPDWFCADGERE